MIPPRSQIKLGVVPTHLKFVGGLAPDENGKLPRDADGRILAVTEMAHITEASPTPLDCVQISVFPGTDADDVTDLMNGLKALDLEVHLVLMVGGADPMNPDDEDAVVTMLVDGLKSAIKHGVTHVGSTSVEEWMKPGATRKDGADFDAAVAQNVKVHLRAAEEAGLRDSCIEDWHVEFLRPGEFATFTDLGRIWTFIQAANEGYGAPFFKALVDAAHCGDSALSIPENEAIIADMGAAGGLGFFHASAKTTRGCLSTDDGWISALLTAAARTGALEYAIVELFHHEDAALEGLRNLDPGHGVDTTDGRSYTELVVDGLTDVSRRLNNLVARGFLPSK